MTGRLPGTYLYSNCYSSFILPVPSKLTQEQQLVLRPGVHFVLTGEKSSLTCYEKQCHKLWSVWNLNHISYNTLVVSCLRDPMPDVLVYVIFFNFVQQLFFVPLSSKKVHKTAILRNMKIKSCVDFDTWEFPVSFLRVSNGLNILCTLHEHCFQGKNSFENPLTNTALGTLITREPCSTMLLCCCWVFAQNWPHSFSVARLFSQKSTNFFQKVADLAYF